MLPNDPVMLLSYINTKLRDEYDSFESLCENLDADKTLIKDKLLSIGYKYDKEINQFK